MDCLAWQKLWSDWYGTEKPGVAEQYIMHHQCRGRIANWMIYIRAFSHMCWNDLSRVTCFCASLNCMSHDSRQDPKTAFEVKLNGFLIPSLTFQSSLDSPLPLKPFNIVQGSCSLSESTSVLARTALDRIQMSLQSSAYVLENDDKFSRGLFFVILILRNLSSVVWPLERANWMRFV